jgi:ferredoxin--NADP+ reductase
MNTIVKATWIAKDTREIWFRNPLISEKFQAGQFVIIHKNNKSERIPLTIVDTDKDLIRIIVQKAGYSTAKLCAMSEGEIIKDVAGPLGKSAEIKKFGNVVCIAGGIGSAAVKPVAASLKAAGNKLSIIEGVRCRDYLILREEFEELADKTIITSDDGTVGMKALVTSPLKEMINSDEKIDLVFAVGPAVMMQAVAKITKEHNIPLTVSLSPIMVDGTGMCGSCRVEIAGETKFACVDGPEFDGNKVNYKLLINRSRMYEREEKLLKWDHEPC